MLTADFPIWSNGMHWRFPLLAPPEPFHVKYSKESARHLPEPSCQQHSQEMCGTGRCSKWISININSEITSHFYKKHLSRATHTKHNCCIFKLHNYRLVIHSQTLYSCKCCYLERDWNRADGFRGSFNHPSLLKYCSLFLNSWHFYESADC